MDCFTQEIRYKSLCQGARNFAMIDIIVPATEPAGATGPSAVAFPPASPAALSALAVPVPAEQPASSAPVAPVAAQTAPPTVASPTSSPPMSSATTASVPGDQPPSPSTTAQTVRKQAVAKRSVARPVVPRAAATVEEGVTAPKSRSRAAATKVTGAKETGARTARAVKPASAKPRAVNPATAGQTARKRAVVKRAAPKAVATKVAPRKQASAKTAWPRAAKALKPDAAVHPAGKAAPEASLKVPLNLATATAAKDTAKPKGKLVRDSFTIPKTEYAVLDELKQRAARLTRPAKKSEILRAGISALNAMPDAAFLAALSGVPSLSTGRPKHAKTAADRAAAKKA